MKAISALPKHGVSILPVCRPWPGLVLANGVLRQQSWVGELVIRCMSDFSRKIAGRGHDER